ncbi:MAG TPA: hypothetical protein ENH55_23535 [Aurantimonas coralicida]|uniref:Uncharacterized protein n=2 Tax=root TaxID=1 RepID=A0A9C9NER7_9HYPH|nr:hypothetical protein [Aurantimonas coralicida]HEU00206.1 hypothetical protein [Aurantimonas coralicida]
MSVDGRIELRITTADKAALNKRAEAEGVTLSTLLRRGIRSVLGLPVRLEGDDAIEVVTLRRRVNALAAQLEDVGRTGTEISAIRRGFAQVHADTHSLLGRG